MRSLTVLPAIFSSVLCLCASAQTNVQEPPKIQILFSQPVLDGVAGNFHVPIAEHKYPIDKIFNMVLWQPNPNRTDGELVPSTWKAGDRTGFYPGAPLSKHQYAFRDTAESSTVQVEGETVGVYINSADLDPGPSAKSRWGIPDGKMMMTPAFKLPDTAKVAPFENPTDALAVSMDLQIPTAHDLNKPGNFTYVVIDFVLRDRKSKTQITYEMVVFHHTPTAVPPPSVERLRATEIGAFDGPSQTFQINNSIEPASRLLTVLPGSALSQNQPWTGWKHYRAAITRDNFATGLRSLADAKKEFHGSLDSADYLLTEVHLNAELTFKTGPADLGWSMRGEKIALVPAARLNDLGSF